MSYNVRLFDLYNWSNRNSTNSDMFDFLKMQSPDILCVQEFYSRAEIGLPSLEKILENNSMDYFHVAFRTINGKQYHSGLATFSRFPIVYRGEIEFDDPARTCIYTDIKIYNDTIRFYNNHLASVHFTRENYSLLDSNYRSNQGMTGVYKLLSKLNKGYKRRSLQADAIAAHKNKSPYPVIICGDFNDIPVSYTYNIVRGDLKDAFIESGTGIGETYISNLFPLRIDFILHSNNINSFRFKVHRVNLSDHYPIECLLEFE